MKIGKETIPGLTQRNIAAGLAYYWEPSPAQRRAKWKTLALGMVLPTAITAAKKRNDEVDTWRAGGAAPAEVARFTRKATFGHVIDRYEKEELATKADNTRRVDATAIKRLRQWAGDMPWQWINRKRVKVLRDAMMEHAELDGPGHSAAFSLLVTLRKILAWWIREEDLQIKNPADEFGLRAPAARDQIWERDCVDAFVVAARALGMPSLSLALRIALYIGQRQKDVLEVQRARWRPLTIEQLDGDQALYDRLCSDHGPDAGQPMGIYVRQNKTKRWVGVPIEGVLRDDIETAIAANHARAIAAGTVQAQHIVINENTGVAWGQSDFIHTFGEVRDAAAAVAIMDGDEDLAERLADLNFQDTRRTCIVTLGILNLNDYTIGSISGHSQATIKKILEVYMPRTEAAAARGVVARIGPATAPAGAQQQEKKA